jgi:hypothetical protein
MFIRTKILSSELSYIWHLEESKLSLNAELDQAGRSKFIDRIQSLQIWGLTLIKYKPS